MVPGQAVLFEDGVELGGILIKKKKNEQPDRRRRGERGVEHAENEDVHDDD